MSKKVTQETNKNKSKELDQFYTHPDYAKSFMSIINNNVQISKYDIQLEPSAGSGNFFNLLDVNKRIGLDIDPKVEEIQKIDFFSWEYPIDKSIISIGNPPFGKNASLAIKFFNYSAKFSECIAFVLPRTFRKTSVINRLDENFHLIFDETVPDNSFIFENKSYNVPCCSQIWMKKPEKREKTPTFKISQLSEYFEIVKPEFSDFSVQRVGGKAGQIRTDDRKNFSELSNFFIKAHKDFVLDIFKEIKFDSVKHNTAGNPSVSPSELVELFVDKAKNMGYTITLKSLPDKSNGKK